MYTVINKYGSPQVLYDFSVRWGMTLLWLSGVIIALGMVWGLGFSPEDYQMRDSVRIMYVHVPSAWMSMFVYVLIAFWSVVGLVWRIKMAYALAEAAVPIGAAFTFLSLATGSLWGIPTWGTWWEWDARMTSQLLLLFIYIGLFILRFTYSNTQRADKSIAVLAIVGSINIPIIRYSVVWWNSLHQTPSISSMEKIAEPSIASSMLWPLLICFIGFNLYFLAVLLVRLKGIILQREKRASWVRSYYAK